MVLHDAATQELLKFDGVGRSLLRAIVKMHVDSPVGLSPMPYCPLALSKSSLASYALLPWFEKRYQAQAFAHWSTDVTVDAKLIW